MNTQIKPAYDGVIINSLQVVDAQTMAVSSEIRYYRPALRQFRRSGRIRK